MTMKLQLSRKGSLLNKQPNTGGHRFDSLYEKMHHYPPNKSIKNTGEGSLMPNPYSHLAEKYYGSQSGLL
jgi:hypothetical protein